MSDIARFRKSVKTVSYGMLGLLEDAAIHGHRVYFCGAKEEKNPYTKWRLGKRVKEFENILLVINEEKKHRGLM